MHAPVPSCRKGSTGSETRLWRVNDIRCRSRALFHHRGSQGAGAMRCDAALSKARTRSTATHPFLACQLRELERHLLGADAVGVDGRNGALCCLEQSQHLLGIRPRSRLERVRSQRTRLSQHASQYAEPLHAALTRRRASFVVHLAPGQLPPCRPFQGSELNNNMTRNWLYAGGAASKRHR